MLEWARMFSKLMHVLNVSLLALATTIILVVAACADDGEEAPTVPVDTPTASLNPVVEALTAYVAETGLGDDTFELSEPVNCKAILPDADTEATAGKICIHFVNSHFDETSGVAEVWVYGTGVVWELTFELQDGDWVVVGADETTPPATPQADEGTPTTGSALPDAPGGQAAMSNLG